MCTYITSCVSTWNLGSIIFNCCCKLPSDPTEESRRIKLLRNASIALAGVAMADTLLGIVSFFSPDIDVKISNWEVTIPNWVITSGTLCSAFIAGIGSVYLRTMISTAKFEEKVLMLESQVAKFKNKEDLYNENLNKLLDECGKLEEVLENSNKKRNELVTRVEQLVQQAAAIYATESDKYQTGIKKQLEILQKIEDLIKNNKPNEPISWPSETQDLFNKLKKQNEETKRLKLANERTPLLGDRVLPV